MKLDKEALEKACKAAFPKLFSDDRHTAHIASSPVTVEYAQGKKRIKIEAAITAYLSAAPVSEEAVEKGARAIASRQLLRLDGLDHERREMFMAQSRACLLAAHKGE